MKRLRDAKHDDRNKAACNKPNGEKILISDSRVNVTFRRVTPKTDWPRKFEVTAPLLAF